MGGKGKERCPTGGISQVVANLNSLSPELLVNRFGRRTALIENSAGEGGKPQDNWASSKIGWNWEDLHHFGKYLHPYYGLCIDTQHSWGAGLATWQSPEEVDSFFCNLDAAIPDRFTLLHLNDSEVAFGSHKDRHLAIGVNIWSTDRTRTGLAQLLKRCSERNVDIILETSGDIIQIAAQGLILEWARDPATWSQLRLP